MCYQGGGQRPAVTGGNAEGNQPAAGEGVHTDSDTSDGDEESPNELQPTEPTFY